jgi:glutamate synthase domain-containing protein 2
VRREFYLVSAVAFAFIGLVSFFWTPFAWSLLVVVPVFVVGMVDALQTRHAIRRNFPVIGNFRYFFELVRPELQQYFVESNQSGRPIPRELRSVVYQRAKGQTETIPFGTQLDVHMEHYEWVNHSIVPQTQKLEEVRVQVGGPGCSKPYSANILNISAMSYGALSSAAVSALNHGAQKGRFYHNTGEGGISPYHLLGADIVWQIGTGYFGCRTPDGKFSDEAFQARAILPSVKMIEIKLSQGAKPGKGGLLPAAKVNKEVSQIRLVPMGKDVISPAGHSAFSTPLELLNFIQKLRGLSGGKPVGFKLCIGARHEFLAICKAMLETGIKPDFITVDGGEGGTGAAPLEFSNYVGTPLEDGLVFVVDALRGFDLKKDIRVIASGKVITSFDILKKIALGADMVNSARGMMLAMGCIQALRCNTNECPTGIATSDKQLMAGLNVTSKSERVYRFQHETVHHLIELLSALGAREPGDVQRESVNRRLTNGEVRTYEELHPVMPEGHLLDSKNWNSLSAQWQSALCQAQSGSFKPLRPAKMAPSPRGLKADEAQQSELRVRGLEFPQVFRILAVNHIFVGKNKIGAVGKGEADARSGFPLAFPRLMFVFGIGLVPIGVLAAEFPTNSELWGDLPPCLKPMIEENSFRAGNRIYSKSVGVFERIRIGGAGLDVIIEFIDVLHFKVLGEYFG